MKIRIKGNTVRYRLSRGEVAALAAMGKLEEKTAFFHDTLTYAIEATDNTELSGDLHHNVITLYVPKPALQNWAGSELVGMENTLRLPGGGTLYLLLEKDFKCIDAAVKEDQSDYFENPLLTC